MACLLRIDPHQVVKSTGAYLLLELSVDLHCLLDRIDWYGLAHALSESPASGLTLAIWSEGVGIREDRPDLLLLGAIGGQIVLCLAYC
jgi:hypothetical protein